MLHFISLESVTHAAYWSYWMESVALSRPLLGWEERMYKKGFQPTLTLAELK